MPDTAQSLFDLFPPGLTAPYMLEHADGSTSVDPAMAIDALFADCDAVTAHWAVSRLRLHKASTTSPP